MNQQIDLKTVLNIGKQKMFRLDKLFENKLNIYSLNC